MQECWVATYRERANVVRVIGHNYVSDGSLIEVGNADMIVKKGAALCRPMEAGCGGCASGHEC